MIVPAKHPLGAAAHDPARRARRGEPAAAQRRPLLPRPGARRLPRVRAAAGAGQAGQLAGDDPQHGDVGDGHLGAAGHGADAEVRDAAGARRSTSRRRRRRAASSSRAGTAFRAPRRSRRSPRRSRSSTCRSSRSPPSRVRRGLGVRYRLFADRQGAAMRRATCAVPAAPQTDEVTMNRVHNRIVTMIAAAGLAGGAACAFAADGAKWSYGGATGPANWGKLDKDYATCGEGRAAVADRHSRRQGQEGRPAAAALQLPAPARRSSTTAA